MDPWELFRRVGDANKFRILHLLAKEPHSPKNLADKTKLSGSTVRTELRSLRKCGFITPEGNRHNRRYSLAKSLPSVAHELILAVILRSDVRIEARPQQDRSRLSPERVKRLQQRAFTEITKTILDQLFVHQGYGRRRRKLDDLRETLRDIDDRIDQDTS